MLIAPSKKHASNNLSRNFLLQLENLILKFENEVQHVNEAKYESMVMMAKVKYCRVYIACSIQK